MAKDKDKEAYYFSHDSNARNDPKIGAMRCVYGSEGYGWYWMIIEMLRDQKDFMLKLQSKYTFRAIALQLQCEPDTAEKFVYDCIDEFELFESDGTFFWSNSLIRRMRKKEDKSEKMSENARKRWDSGKSNANEMQLHSKSNALKESKVKEIKGKEIKEELQQSDAADSPNPYLQLIDAFCDLHKKGDWQLRENERKTMKELLALMPLEFIVGTMQKVYKQKMEAGEKITSFYYYENPIKDAWKASEASGQYEPGNEGSSTEPKRGKWDGLVN